MSDRPVERSYDPHCFPEFEPPYLNQQFDDIMYEVSGRNRAENQLITIARDEFLRCWLADERVTARLQTWGATVGLPEIINDVAAFLDRVTNRYGFSRRADLGRIARPPHISIDDLLPEWYGLQDRLYAAYRRSPEVRDAACTYVCDELQQPWRWLAYRLIAHVFQQAWERAEGITMIRQRTSHLDPIMEPRVQPFRFVFETRHGETVAEANHRLMAEARAACANLLPIESESQSLPKGKVRPDRELKTQRNTKWLHVHLIGKVHGPSISIYSIAKLFHSKQDRRREHKEFPRCSCQVDVRKGIKSAQALLDLTPYQF
jgi:hypothetical protein